MSKTQKKEKAIFDFSAFWRKLFLCAFAFMMNFSFAQIYASEGVIIYDAEKSIAVIFDSTVCKPSHTVIKNIIDEGKFIEHDYITKTSKNSSKTSNRAIIKKKIEIKKIQNTVKLNPLSKAEEFFLIDNGFSCAMICSQLLKINAVLLKILNLKPDLKIRSKALKNSDFTRIATAHYHPDYRSRPPPFFS